MIVWLLACHPAAPPAAPTPVAPFWFDVEPGKPLCVSRFPDAEPLSAEDAARFDAAIGAVARSEYAAGVDGLAALPGHHPAVEGALALVGLLVGQAEATTTLLRLSDEHPGDACALVGAALAAGAEGDVGGASDRVLRARKLAPEAANLVVLSWYMDLQSSEVLRPALEQANAAEPANPAVAFALGLERVTAGEDGTTLLEQALDAGVDVAAGPLLVAYHDTDRRPEYLKLASRLGLLFDDGRVAGSADPEAAFDTLVGRGPGEHLQATLRTSMGDLSCTLLPDVAPVTVAAFVGLSRGTVPWVDPRDGQSKRAPLYDGTSFHRVIPGFMVQGGDPLGTGQGGPGWQIPDELHPDVKFDVPGLLAMANAGPNTNGSQFFVTEGPVAHL